MFVGGNLALDLAGTRKWRRDRPAELLVDPGDLGAWFVAAGVLDEPPVAGPADLDEAIRLREAVYTLAAAHAAGRRLSSGPVRVVNGSAAPAPVRPELVGSRLRRRGDVAAGLSDVARSLLVLLAGADVVKECARPACTRLYVDRSRGQRRSWCGMDECGSQSKMAAYRARRKNA
jgi:predicted RNA-binding Zn ribbon-like protein